MSDTYTWILTSVGEAISDATTFVGSFLEHVPLVSACSGLAIADIDESSVEWRRGTKREPGAEVEKGDAYEVGDANSGLVSVQPSTDVCETRTAQQRRRPEDEPSAAGEEVASGTCDLEEDLRASAVREAVGLESGDVAAAAPARGSPQNEEAAGRLDEEATPEPATALVRKPEDAVCRALPSDRLPAAAELATPSSDDVTSPSSCTEKRAQRPPLMPTSSNVSREASPFRRGSPQRRPATPIGGGTRFTSGELAQVFSERAATSRGSSPLHLVNACGAERGHALAEVGGHNHEVRCVEHEPPTAIGSLGNKIGGKQEVSLHREASSDRRTSDGEPVATTPDDVASPFCRGMRAWKVSALVMPGSSTPPRAASPFRRASPRQLPVSPVGGGGPHVVGGELAQAFSERAARTLMCGGVSPRTAVQPGEAESEAAARLSANALVGRQQDTFCGEASSDRCPDDLASPFFRHTRARRVSAPMMPASLSPPRAASPFHRALPLRVPASPVNDGRRLGGGELAYVFSERAARSRLGLSPRQVVKPVSPECAVEAHVATEAESPTKRGKLREDAETFAGLLDRRSHRLRCIAVETYVELRGRSMRVYGELHRKKRDLLCDAFLSPAFSVQRTSDTSWRLVAPSGSRHERELAFDFCAPDREEADLWEQRLTHACRGC